MLLMGKRERQSLQPLVLWGEGYTEQLFLELFKKYYRKELARKQIKVGSGRGRSPGSILEALDKQELWRHDPQTPALALLDADRVLDQEAKAVLKKYTREGQCSIKILYSKPQCLEGLLLDLLDDLPPKGQQTSKYLKKRFEEEYLKSCDHVQSNFKKKREKLFPKELLDQKLLSHPILRELREFIGLELPESCPSTN